MLQDVHKFISYFSVCAQAKVPHNLPVGRLMPLHALQQCSHLANDFIMDEPPSQHTTIILVIDRFSKSICLIPLPGFPSALETAELIFNHVLRYFGIPEDIVSDQGAQFTSAVWRGFMEKLRVSISLTSGYHPQASGQVERANQEVRHFVYTFCANNQEDWAQFLSWAKYVQNFPLSNKTLAISKSPRIPADPITMEQKPH